MASGKPVIGPILYRKGDSYSNYHCCADPRGYFKQCEHYFPLLSREAAGLHKVDVIHCTYLVRKEVLKEIVYDDGSGDYEYVIFSRALRNAGVPQFLDTRRNYGCLTMAESRLEFVRQQNPVPCGGYTTSLMLETFAAQYDAAGRFLHPREEVDPAYVVFLQECVRADAVSSVTELGCGDWHASRLIDWFVVERYEGIDCVPAAIARCREDEIPGRVEFTCGDFVADPAIITPASLCLIRRVLEYWPSEMIASFLRQVISRRLFSQILITTMAVQNEQTRKMALGDFRELSPLMMPLLEFSPKIVLHSGNQVTMLIKCEQ